MYNYRLYRAIFVLYQRVRSPVRMYIMTKSTQNVKTTLYQRYQCRIQIDAARYR